MKPLVSILIPAYNSEKWISYTLESVIAQTWPNKEIIVLNDGSTDQTEEIARGYASRGVEIVTTANQGVAAACNHAFNVCRGDYVQWLAADDVLAPDKIERQIAALRDGDSKRLLLSSPWAHFYYRTHRARFVPTALWQDLSPVEWLLRKMSMNLHMQPSTWLTSRELIEAAGPEDTRLVFDDDGEFYCRVLLASEGTRFVPDAKVFYRMTPSSRVSHIGSSDKKKDALALSMKLHVRYLQSLEQSERVRKTCLTYLQNWYEVFYPERPDLIKEIQRLAELLHGQMEVPRLRWKYAWMRSIFGWKTAKWAQDSFPQIRATVVRNWDKAMFNLEARQAIVSAVTPPTGVAQQGPTQRTARLADFPDRSGLGSRASSAQILNSTPLVSILIPAYNTEAWIEETIRSALDQTWKRKEIIIVDDGSTDRTLALARQYESEILRVVSQKNQGAAAARNVAIELSHGDYIQWLDADDLLARDKIERQLAALREGPSKRVLLSSPWAPFYYRIHNARFVRTSLCQDLSPVEWLIRKMNENLFMQPATWLTSRELLEAAGPWDTRLTFDDDGEYFCRVLLASEGTRFVPETGTFYRVTGTNRLSHLGLSEGKLNSLFVSMKLHVQYLRSIEDSERVQKACLTYLDNWYWHFYPECRNIVAELQGMASGLQGHLGVPHLRWKYAWIRPILGWEAAKSAQMLAPHMRISAMRCWDKAMRRFDSGQPMKR